MAWFYLIFRRTAAWKTGILQTTMQWEVFLRVIFAVNEDGNAVFEGYVSLENNGGFCMVRYNASSISAAGYETVTFRVKGDGKRYQFRAKVDRDDYYSLIDAMPMRRQEMER